MYYRGVVAPSDIDVQLGDSCIEGDLTRVKELCCKGANVESEHPLSGTTPLMLASWNGHVDIVTELLVNRNANPQHSDKMGLTSLHYACEDGYCDVAEILIKHGVPINAQTKGGSTALHLAVEKNNIALAGLLLENDADQTIQDIYGKTVEDIAKENNNDELIALLQAEDDDEIRSIYSSHTEPRKSRPNAGASHGLEDIFRLRFKNEQLQDRIKKMTKGPRKPKYKELVKEVESLKERFNELKKDKEKEIQDLNKTVSETRQEISELRKMVIELRKQINTRSPHTTNTTSHHRDNTSSSSSSLSPAERNQGFFRPRKVESARSWKEISKSSKITPISDMNWGKRDEPPRRGPNFHRSHSDVKAHHDLHDIFSPSRISEAPNRRYSSTPPLVEDYPEPSHRSLFQDDIRSPQGNGTNRRRKHKKSSSSKSHYDDYGDYSGHYRSPGRRYN